MAWRLIAAIKTRIKSPIHEAMKNRKAIVLLSGGLDSATVLYWALREGYRPHALIFDYGQRHKREIRGAKALLRRTGVTGMEIPIRMPWGGSSLLDKGSRVPVKRRAQRMQKDIPSTYVPARNTVFLSIALSYAEAIGAGTILIGANALDYSGYPDCRPSYFKAFGRMAKLATKVGVQGKAIRVRAPLLKKTKAQIVRLGHALGVPLEWTWSCYAGKARPCGACDSCVLRAKGFFEAGLADPAL